MRSAQGTTGPLTGDSNKGLGLAAETLDGMVGVTGFEPAAEPFLTTPGYLHTCALTCRYRTL